MTEKDIQSKIYLWKVDHQSIIIPNKKITFWEADILIITKADILYEYEIKISRTDFKKDTKDKKQKHHCLQKGIGLIPNYFYYCCPAELIKEQEIPEYSGLIYFKENDAFGELIKKAPKLTDKKCSNDFKNSCFMSMYYRYWKYVFDNN